LKESQPTKVMSCALVSSTDLEKDLEVAKEVTGGAGVPSTKMASWLANPLAGRPWFAAILSPMMRANNHQCAKVPLILEAIERA
jgi:hypothetical protein